MKKILIYNNYKYHFEIIESMIVKFRYIFNLDSNIKVKIYLYIREYYHELDNCKSFLNYIKNKYPDIILVLNWWQSGISSYDYYLNCTIYDNDKHLLNTLSDSNEKYISHEITDDLKKNPNVYFLTPLAKKNFLYADILPFSNIKKKTNIPIFLIQGFISNDRRHHRLAYRIFQKNTFSKIMSSYKFKFKFLGWGNGLPNRFRNYSDKIILRQNLNFQDYHKELSDVYCILPLISKDKYPDYYNNKLTSSINYAKAYNLKCIIDKDLQDIYNLENAEIYNDITDITDAFLNVLKEFYEQN